MEHGQLERPLRDQPQPPPPPPQMDREDDDVHQGPSLLTVFGFLFLTFNSVMAVYRSNRDFWAISFVVFSYLVLVLLFYCLRQYEKERPESPRRERLKVAVWLLTTMLTAVFSYKVAAIMPFPVQVLVWAMAGATVLGGFYAFFVYTEPKPAAWRERQKKKKSWPLDLSSNNGHSLKRRSHPNPDMLHCSLEHLVADLCIIQSATGTLLISAFGKLGHLKRLELEGYTTLHIRSRAATLRMSVCVREMGYIPKSTEVCRWYLQCKQPKPSFFFLRKSSCLKSEANCEDYGCPDKVCC